MEDLDQKIRGLLGKATWTQQEREWVTDYLQTDIGSELRDDLEAAFYLNAGKTNGQQTALADEVLAGIHQKINAGSERKRFQFSHRLITAVAAAVCLFVAGRILFQANGSSKTVTAVAVQTTSHNNATAADSNTAGKIVLTLADGTSVLLGTDSNKRLSNQGGANVFTKGNSLAYHAAAESPLQEPVYNTLSTPKGNSFQLSLSDGTKVWLDAASSIRYPAVFAGNERTVEITGEAYFEVAKDPSKPFTVKVGQSAIEVLGTHFNVSAYGNESFLTTTLLEGAVKFISGGYTSILRPGQQSRLTRQGKVLISNDADTEDVLAWKNGLFHFEHENIRSVMNQLARWYDIEVLYPGTELKDLFSADIPRSTSLPEVLKLLELTRKVKFKLEGKQVFVTI